MIDLLYFFGTSAQNWSFAHEIGNTAFQRYLIGGKPKACECTATVIGGMISNDTL